jgi:AcrR family transcriptional regulator/sporulation protein YlmC with PRC-barrel domain
LSAAWEAFTRLGYDGVGVREIARAAQVDPRLIGRYFGSKEGLFAEVVDLAYEKSLMMAPELNAEAARALLTGTDQSAVDGMLLTLRSAANPRAAAIMRDSIERNYQARLADALPGTDTTSRAALLIAICAGGHPRPHAARPHRAEQPGHREPHPPPARRPRRRGEGTGAGLTVSQRDARDGRGGKAAMAEETEFAMGAEASCVDGPGGKVTRLIIDPATETVTHLVIEPKHRMGNGRLVPLDLVDSTADGIRLRCTVEEFGSLEPAEEMELVDNVIGGLSGPAGISSPVQAVVQDVVPLGATDIERGERVHALDGEIGRVHGCQVDPDNYRVTHVLLGEGHLWGKKEVAIPASAVTKVENGIWLNLTKKQVEDLPPVG